MRTRTIARTWGFEIGCGGKRARKSEVKDFEEGRRGFGVVEAERKTSVHGRWREASGGLQRTGSGTAAGSVRCANRRGSFGNPGPQLRGDGHRREVIAPNQFRMPQHEARA